MKHPTYLEMCAEAIASLGKRGGSSARAVAKFVEGKYGPALPPTFIFRRLLSHRLRRLVALRQLVKVKASYKLPPARYRRSTSPSNRKTKARLAPPASRKDLQPTANNGANKEEQYDHEQQHIADADAVNKKTNSTATITTPSSSPRKRPGPRFKELLMSSMIFYAMKRKRPASSASCVVPRRKLRRYGDSVLRPILPSS